MDLNYETVFIALGVAAAVLAVIVSVYGIKNHAFPKSAGPMYGLIILFAAILVGAGYTSWQSAAEHQAEHRAHEAEVHE